ncbi:DsbA family protein [Pseudonocardia benzenivorans]
MAGERTPDTQAVPRRRRGGAAPHRCRHDRRDRRGRRRGGRRRRRPAAAGEPHRRRRGRADPGRHLVGGRRPRRRRQGGGGRDDGQGGRPATIDVYEDFLCPICGQFEHTYGDQIRQAVTDGKLDVRYHVVNLLDDRSDPPGYSMAAASAALAVAEADPGAFASFHDSLYGAQPSEGGRGYDANQLDALATALGVPKGRVADALASKEFDQAVQTSLQTAATNPALRQQTSAGSGFGTPTVAVDGRLVDVSDPNWLTAILAAH